MINNIINNIIYNIIYNKNVKLYFYLFLILLLLLFFLYLTNYSTNYYRKKENFEQNNTSQKNTITKNINNIEVPADFLPTHPWTNKKSGLDILDNPQEHYLYKDDEKIEKYDKDSSQFTRSFICRPSITGVFSDCGPYSFNACGPIKPSTSEYHESKDKKHKKHRKHRNHRNDRNGNNEEISIFCDKNICHHIYHHNRRNWSTNIENKNHYDNEDDNNDNNDNIKYRYRKTNSDIISDSNKNTKKQDQLDYDEYMNDLDGY